MSATIVKPELKTVRVGFVPLSDSASILMAAEKGFDRQHGIHIQPVYKASWSQIRDGLVNGELDAAHSLYGMVYGAHLGIGSVTCPMAILMGLNQNGQGITFSQPLLELGVTTGKILSYAIRQGARPTFGHTFPTGTHAMWLYYWLGAHGIDPTSDIRQDVVAPPKMADAMRRGQVHAFCAGEPWNSLAVYAHGGATIATSQSIWPDHPEKVLTATASWVDAHPETATALVSALLETSRWIEEQADLDEVAQRIGAPDATGLDTEIILGRMNGYYEDGLGRSWRDGNKLKFFNGGEATFPWHSDGIWFLTQFARWGLIDELPDCRALAQQIHQTDIYGAAARRVGVAIPSGLNRRSVLMDGVVWDGSEPQRYLEQFSIRAAALCI